jgi:glucan-binding YG repeat protein
MNKKIKRIIALALIISAFSAIEPTKYFNLMSKKAYATSEIAGLDNLKVCSDSDSYSVKMYEKYDYSKSTKFQTDIFKYYVDLSESTSEFNVRANVDSGYTVKVIDQSNGDKEYDLEDTISIEKNQSKTIAVEITNDSDSSKQIITLKVYRDDNDEDDNDEEISDNIYLEDVTLSHLGDNIKLNFTPKTSTYNINVDSDIDYIKIQAKPKDKDQDKVRINGTDVRKDDDYEERVNLNEGKNEIPIVVKKYEDDNRYYERTYTLVINRGETFSTNISNTTGTSTSVENAETNVTTIKANQWVLVNNKWQYNDATGKAVKDSWIQNYYLQDNGDMATGWLNYSGSWYYLGSDGAKKTGWQLLDGNWYRLDSQGKIQIGWFEDLDGKYYYLNSFGVMAYNTTIDGYKLGADGAWTGK